MSTVVTRQRRPLFWAAMCFMTATVPMMLQALDMLPVGFSITEPGRILIEHRISDASPLTIHTMLIMATLAAIFAPLGFNYRSALLLHETRARLVVHMWQLRQLTRQ